jgi:hypothetical protein
LLNIISGTLSTGAPPFIAGTFESIATVSVGSGGSSAVDFTSIPATYTHLQIRLIAQKLTSSTNGLMRFNSDATSTNYYAHGIEADGSSVAAYATNDFPRAVANVPTTANIFAASVVNILDYANTNKYKTVRILSGVDVNGTVAGYGGVIELVGGNWRSTSAITSITITADSPNYVQYTTFSLYGIK